MLGLWAEVVMQLTEKDEQRFWNKVALPNEQGCMEWMAALNKSGYGAFGVGPRGAHKTHKAHRVSYELLVGPIPDGLVIDHLCRNRKCVVPDHLEPVTSGENTRRGEPAHRTHCTKGHEYTPENTLKYASNNGWRQCRTCAQVNARKQYAKQRSE